MTGFKLVSIVIPVYNEEDCLNTLYQRVSKVMEASKTNYEVVFVNDGSQDRSSDILRSLFDQDPQHVRVIELSQNSGQYIAIMAGFDNVKGDVVINLDADLQNPPEEIPNLLAQVEQGYDFVGSYRAGKRQDRWYRTYFSKFVNRMRERMIGVKMRDHGCMLRAYRRDLIESIKKYMHTSPNFVTVLAYTLAKNPTEVPVKHEARELGDSKYNIFQLARLSLDLFTGFSLAPLQIFTFFGIFVSVCSGFLVVYMLIRRLIMGPEAEGVFTLFAILYFLISVLIMGIGLLGEYIGRTYQAVQRRPKFIVKTILEQQTVGDVPTKTIHKELL